MVPVLSKTIVSTFPILSIPSIFLRNKPFKERIFVAEPNVNGPDKAKAQGHATINTAVNTVKALDGSIKNQVRHEAKAITITINVK